MSTWSKWVVVIVVLAFLIPFIRRMVRGELRDDGISSGLPPSGPDVGGV